MLKVINTCDEWVSQIIKDDPVRPHLTADYRINEVAEMFGLYDDKEYLSSVCCVRYTDGIPNSVNDMTERSSMFSDTAVFYTIWSYSKGSGRKLIIDASNWITENRPQIKNLVTLSPTTEMAERFHLRNGAVKWRINEDSVNYAYQLKA
jgi:hypothetical protein